MEGRGRPNQADQLSLLLTWFPGLLAVTILVLLNHLDHLSLARNLPITTPSPGMFQCLSHSQNLLRAISNTLQKVSFPVLLCPLCSLSRGGASLNPGSPERTAKKLWTLLRSCQEGERELYKGPNY